MILIAMYILITVVTVITVLPMDFGSGASVASTSQVRESHAVIADCRNLISTSLEWPRAA
jgi:hypothetical protein